MREPRICAYCDRRYVAIRANTRYCRQSCSAKAERDRTLRRQAEYQASRHAHRVSNSSRILGWEWRPNFIWPDVVRGHRTEEQGNDA